MTVYEIVYETGKKSQSKQAGKEKKKKKHLIYIALTIEFGQQYFLNVSYSGLDM